MIFVDTNYFLRFLLADNEPQYSKAKGLFLQAARGHVELVTSVVVFFEIAWVIRSAYKKENKGKTELIQMLEKLLALEIKFPERDVLVKSLNFLANTTLSLEDCYHLAFCKTKGIVKIETFDEKLAKEFSRQ